MKSYICTTAITINSGDAIGHRIGNHEKEVLLTMFLTIRETEGNYRYRETECNYRY